MPDNDAEKRFTALYLAHHRQVYAYAVSRGGRQIADEVVNQAFTVAWVRFSGVPDRPLPWLLGVTRNILFEQARSARGRESLAQELRAWIQPEDEVAGDPAELVSERASLRTALTKLSDSDRELLTLIAWQGLTQAEAALVVGCSSATFAVRLHRARRRLEQALDDSSRPR